jgi:hypothetical protein
MKRFLDLTRNPRELDDVFSLGDVTDLESVRLQPLGHSLDVLVGRTELLAKVFRREPLMVVWRALILLIVEQRQQRTFLRSAALEHQQHPVHRQVRRGYATIILRTRQRMCIALQDRSLGLIDALNDERRNNWWLFRGTWNAEG